jgi:hypothetical protein
MQQTHEAVMQNATAHKQQIYADPSHVFILALLSSFPDLRWNVLACILPMHTLGWRTQANAVLYGFEATKHAPNRPEGRGADGVDAMA